MMNQGGGAGTPPAVLVVDDEPHVLDLLALGLPFYGLKVFPTPNGAEAVEALRRNADAIGVALIDLRMPGMDGARTVQALRTLKPDLACCVMAGFVSPEDEERLKGLGARVATKPFALSAIAELLLDLHGWPSPGAAAASVSRRGPGGPSRPAPRA